MKLKSGAIFHDRSSSGEWAIGTALIMFKAGYYILLVVSLKIWGNFEAFEARYWPIEVDRTLRSHFMPYDASFYLSLSE